MIPAYFPFTTIGTVTMDSLMACPGPAIVYRPSRLNLPDHLRLAADAGRIDIRTPVVEDEAELEKRIQAYRDWAQLHAGGQAGWLKARGDTVPFHDQGSTSGIRSDLRRRMDGVDRSTEPDALFTARIFLEVAQERDHRQWEVEQELVRLDAKEKELYRQLRPDADADLGLQPAFTAEVDPGLTMIGERMAAWARLMLADTGTRPGWLVTDSFEAIEWIRERIAGVCPVADGQPLSLSLVDNASQQRDLADFVAGLSQEEGESVPSDVLGGSPKGDHLEVVLYRVTGMSIERLVGQWVSKSVDPEARSRDKAVAAGHAVFARIQAVCRPQ
ncbi:MAG: hypothetical protein JEZ11_04820 [Desulfobacterales bacterium]|nr:hypothetical protein [Desulfobacterales bacterium]